MRHFPPRNKSSFFRAAALDEIKSNLCGAPGGWRLVSGVAKRTGFTEADPFNSRQC